MNDDLVVQKILKLLENNTAFIGYALNGGIGTKINVRNTETGKTIQALSINVNSSGEVLVVKDSEDGKYKAVTFKAAEQVTERVIQIRKTKPIDDKKIIEYTEADIEVFYLFVKLVNTGSPVPTQLQSTWIRKGSSCTQFVGAYERCNYAAKETIGGTSYTGLPYKPYSSLNDCLNNDLSRDARSPHGSGDSNGGSAGWKIYSTLMTSDAEQSLRAALESHDNHYGTNYKKGFGYGSILDCSGAMYVQGWSIVNPTEGEPYFHCDFSYLPGFTLDCTLEQQNAGYCDNRGFISSKAPLFGEEEEGQPSLNQVDNSWGHTYGWVDLAQAFMYKRHFPPLYLNGDSAGGSFLILEVNADQEPDIPEGFLPWSPGCPSGGNGGPFNGTGGLGFNGGIPSKPKKRDMKLSTHKAEIWLGSSKKEQAIKLYELGASDLFSGMYNAFIIKANETQVDIENRLQRGFTNTSKEVVQHNNFYENWNKNIIDLNIDPRVWVTVSNNHPEALFQGNFHDFVNPQNYSLQGLVDGLYQRTLNLSVIDKKTQIVHLKLNLKPSNTLSNTDCKGNITFLGKNDGEKFSSQSWEYQKYITIKIEDWVVTSTTNNLDTSNLDYEDIWNKDHIKRKFLTSFGTYLGQLERDNYIQLLSRHNSNVDFSEIVTGNHFEQYNYSNKKLFPSYTLNTSLYASYVLTFKPLTSADSYRRTALSTASWWEMWDKTLYNKKEKRLSSIVGFDLNHYQILRSSKLSQGLIFSDTTNNTSGDGYPPYTNAVTKESYYEYISDRPKQYRSSIIKALRDKKNTTSYTYLANRQSTLDTIGLLFYFSDWGSRWTNPSINFPYISPPSGSYYEGFVESSALKSERFDLPLTSQAAGKRLDTRRWTNLLWTQLIYDGFVNVDVDSYKDVEFNSLTNPSQYIKYTTQEYYNNSEYNFSEKPAQETEIETVLLPGVLDVTRQVKITKPTNVDLDPNMSFLVYAYPNVLVTKKKKEI